MSAADLRGFRYGLEPLRQRGEWQIEAVLGALAGVQRQLEECRQRRRRLESVAADQAAVLGTAKGMQVDASARRLSIEYLASVRDETVRVDREIEDLQRRHEALSSDYALRRRKLDMLDEDRARAVAAYSRERETKMANEADSQWLDRIRPQAGQEEPSE